MLEGDALAGTPGAVATAAVVCAAGPGTHRTGLQAALQAARALLAIVPGGLMELPVAEPVFALVPVPKRVCWRHGLGRRIPWQCWAKQP